MATLSRYYPLFDEWGTGIKGKFRYKFGGAEGVFRTSVPEKFLAFPVEKTMNSIDTLANEILKGNAVLFIGAGLSRGAGLSGWEELVRGLASEIGYEVPPVGRRIPTEMLVKIPQYFENARGRHALLSRVLDASDTTNKQPTENHRLLAQLPIQTWVTTNWDDLLEMTLREAGRAYRLVIRDQDLPYQSTDTVSLLKMHGDRWQGDTIVITQEDYDSYFMRYPLVKLKLSALLPDKTFLFVGYGLNDPDFNQLRAAIGFYLKQHQRWAYAVVTDAEADAFVIKDLERRHIYVIRAIPDAKQGPSDAVTHVLKALLDKVSIPIAFESIVGEKKRTRQIINTCKSLLREPGKLRDSRYVVRIQAALSSFAIAEEEEYEDKQYHELLLKERNSFIKLIEAGAFVRCIISTVRLRTRIERPRLMELSLVARTKQLLRFLSDKRYFGQYEFVCFHSPRPNQIIFGDEILFEGHKMDVVRGFGLTSVVRDPARIDFEIRAFDKLFTNIRARVLQTSGGSPLLEAAEIQKLLRDALCAELNGALKFLTGPTILGS
jgi:hypothetical protein